MMTIPGAMCNDGVTYDACSQHTSTVHQSMELFMYRKYCSLEIGKINSKCVCIYKFIFKWKIIALHCCVGFCRTSAWISHRHTYIPSFLNLPLTPHWGFDVRFPNDQWCWASFHVLIGHLCIFFGVMSVEVLGPVLNWVISGCCWRWSESLTTRVANQNGSGQR